MSSLVALASVAVRSPTADHAWLLKWFAIPMCLGYFAAAWPLAGWYSVARDEDRESTLPPPDVWCQWRYPAEQYRAWVHSIHEFRESLRTYPYQVDLEKSLKAPESYIDSRGLFIEG